MSRWLSTSPPGWFEESDIDALREIYADLPVGAETLEIGVYRGRSVCSVAPIISERNITVTCIDDFKPIPEDSDTTRYQQFLATLDRFDLTKRVKVIPYNSLSASKLIPDCSQDFIFIDSDHRYEQVTAEIKAYRSKLKPNGKFGGHDYPCAEGVRRAVTEIFPNIRTWERSTVWLEAGATSPPRTCVLGIATPTYDARTVNDETIRNAQRSKRIQGFAGLKAAGSLLTHEHNALWCWGLNARRDGLTHLLFLHSDVLPLTPSEGTWLDPLIDEMWKSGADVLGGIIPIKDVRGLTSTAFDRENIWGPRRLTQTEAHRLPLTWTTSNLLLNTGLLLIKFTDPWVESFAENDGAPFHIADRIVRVGDAWHAEVRSEDWEFSRACHRLNLKLYATRAVKLHHYGNMAYPSHEQWGTPHDADAAPYPEGVDITDTEGNSQHLSFED